MRTTLKEIAESRGEAWVGQFLSIHLYPADAEPFGTAYLIEAILVIDDTVALAVTDAAGKTAMFEFNGSLEPIDSIIAGGDLWFAPGNDYSKVSYGIYDEALSPTWISLSN